MIEDLGGLGLRIDTLWAFIAVHDDRDESILAVSAGDMWVPLIGADVARVEQMRPYAERIVAETGKQVRLARFDTRTDVETLGGPDR